MLRPGGVSEQTHVGLGHVGMTGNGVVVLYCLRAVCAACRMVEVTDSSCVVSRRNGIGYEEGQYKANRKKRLETRQREEK
jgi:hypothetical protein